MLASSLFTREVVAASIEPRRRTTFYTCYGDVFARTVLAAALLGLLGVRLGRAARALRLRATSRPEGVA